MGIPQVTLPVRGLFGVFQHEYAFQKIKYAQTIAEENGVQLLIVSDGAARSLVRIDQPALGNVLSARFRISSGTGAGAVSRTL